MPLADKNFLLSLSFITANQQPRPEGRGMLFSSGG
jgi:hypothetical protein